MALYGRTRSGSGAFLPPYAQLPSLILSASEHPLCHLRGVFPGEGGSGGKSALCVSGGEISGMVPTACSMLCSDFWQGPFNKQLILSSDSPTPSFHLGVSEPPH
ncbi:Hypothetical predicted protein [Podarcis lilfordi]|uniref:Uncharacterized protein n=1 Tax=Podarcis lilfordi TaxID=74358 RepID=A0AA35PLY0_9SAUR|nr:Hypothetical predicted protein [Podarcis lilfordi]